jgi:hypothetical protein
MAEEDTTLVISELEKSLANRQDQVRLVSEFLKPYLDDAKQSKPQAAHGSGAVAADSD